jgi:hypothetical protein
MDEDNKAPIATTTPARAAGRDRHRVTGRAVTAGYLTAESGRHWLSYLADQPFFASATLYIVAAATDMRGLR